MKVLHEMILTCYISRILFRMFNFPYQKYSDVCSSCSVYIYLLQWSVHREPSLWISYMCENTHRSPFGWWYIISPQYTGSVLVKILKVSKHCLGIKNWYRSLLTSATFFRCVQLQPTINITVMPLSWADGCPVECTLDVFIEPGLQNCAKWLRNSIIYSTSCETNNHIPSTAWCHWLLIAYTSMPPSYLHSVSYSISQEICTRILLCCALLWLYIDWFSHIHQAYFTGTVAIWRLPQCQQSNPDEYG